MMRSDSPGCSRAVTVYRPMSSEQLEWVVHGESQWTT